MPTSDPRICILRAPGTNRYRDTFWACRRAGGAPRGVDTSELAADPKMLDRFDMLILPGGFSYGDDLGAGQLWAAKLRWELGDALEAFVESGKPVVGICNGFQALVKAGFLPDLGGRGASAERRVTLTANDSGRFECRWVRLEPDDGCQSPLVDPDWGALACPVAHKEGRVVGDRPDVVAELAEEGLVAFRYAAPDGQKLFDGQKVSGGQQASYPWNPNGSWGDIAGLCNARGNVLGLMPHPENPAAALAAPRVDLGRDVRSGHRLFERAVEYAREFNRV